MAGTKRIPSTHWRILPEDPARALAARPDLPSELRGFLENPIYRLLRAARLRRPRLLLRAMLALGPAGLSIHVAVTLDPQILGRPATLGPSAGDRHLALAAVLYLALDLSIRVSDHLGFFNADRDYSRIRRVLGDLIPIGFPAREVVRGVLADQADRRRPAGLLLVTATTACCLGALGAASLGRIDLQPFAAMGLVVAGFAMAVAPARFSAPLPGLLVGTHMMRNYREVRHLLERKSSLSLAPGPGGARWGRRLAATLLRANLDSILLILVIVLLPQAGYAVARGLHEAALSGAAYLPATAFLVRSALPTFLGGAALGAAWILVSRARRARLVAALEREFALLMEMRRVECFEEGRPGRAGIEG